MMKECKTTCPMSIPTSLMLLGFLLSGIGYIHNTLPLFIAGIIFIVVGLCLFGYNLFVNIRCER